MPKQGKHSLEAIELVKEFVERLEEVEVWDSEIFPYSTIEKLRKEFIETVRDQNEPMEYGGDWYKNRTSKGASLDVLFIAFALAIKTVTVYRANIYVSVLQGFLFSALH